MAKKKAQLFYLLPHFPDVSLIETAFLKLKIRLGAESARTIDTPWRRIEIILGSFAEKEDASSFQEFNINT